MQPVQACTAYSNQGEWLHLTVAAHLTSMDTERIELSTSAVQVRRSPAELRARYTPRPSRSLHRSSRLQIGHGAYHQREACCEPGPKVRFRKLPLPQAGGLHLDLHNWTQTNLKLSSRPEHYHDTPSWMKPAPLDGVTILRD